MNSELANYCPVVCTLQNTEEIAVCNLTWNT